MSLHAQSIILLLKYLFYLLRKQIHFAGLGAEHRYLTFLCVLLKVQGKHKPEVFSNSTWLNQLPYSSLSTEWKRHIRALGISKPLYYSAVKTGPFDFFISIYKHSQVLQEPDYLTMKTVKTDNVLCLTELQTSWVPSLLTAKVHCKTPS